MIIFLPIDLTYVLGAQKNHLIEMVLLSTHNIWFGCENKKNNFSLRTLNQSPDVCKLKKKKHYASRKVQQLICLNKTHHCRSYNCFNSSNINFGKSVKPVRYLKILYLLQP